MIELLRDPAWQFIGALFALLALLASYGIHLKQRQRKELAYGVLSSRRLLSMSTELRGRVEVTVDGKPVEDVHLLIVGVKNSGSVPILESDFLYAPIIRTGKDTELLSVELSRYNPQNLQIGITLHPDRLEIRPLLLNPGDHFSVQALTSSRNPELVPDFRIIGTSKVMLLRKSRPFSDRGDWGALAFWFIFLSLMILVGYLEEPSIASFIFIAIPTAIMLAVFYRWVRSRFGEDSSRYMDDI